MEDSGGSSARSRLAAVIFGNALLAAASLVLMVAALECALRVRHALAHRQVDRTRAARQRDNEWEFFEYDPRLGWRNRPRSAGEFTIPDSRTRVEVDSLGLRDPEHALAKGDRSRILVLGDSFTWGFGVEQGHRYSDVLQRLVGARVEVINAGVSGWGTDQELLFLRGEGLRYSPDLVILGFGLEDVINNHNAVQYTYPKPYFLLENDVLQLHNVPVPRRTSSWRERFGLPASAESAPVGASAAAPARFAWRHLESYRFLRYRLGLLTTRLGWGSAEVPDALTIALIRAMRADVEAAGGRFVVVMIPYRDHVERGSPPPEWAAFQRIFSTDAIPFVDLFRAMLLAARTGPSPYYGIDPHWDPRGHDIAARVIFEQLSSQGLLKPGQIR